MNRPICGELCGEYDSLTTGRGDFAMWKNIFIFGNAEVLLDLFYYIIIVRFYEEDNRSS